MSSTSRAATAASSRRVKQELVRLLFGQESTSATSREACRSKKLDHAMYSYKDLRMAYLEKLQMLHPDKSYSEKDSGRFSSSSSKNNNNYATRHASFVELQEAWTRYDEIAKMAKNVDVDGVDKDRNFTLFGVGCSFSDNEWERQMRADITDQACRGWLSSGSLAAEITLENDDNLMNPSSSSDLSLLDEDDFQSFKISENSDNGDDEGDTQRQQRKPTLIHGNFRPRSVAG